jgi:CRP-like cAMP-binding protein
MPYSQKELVEMMDNIQWFKGFSWAEISNLAGYVNVYQAAQNSIIFDEGDCFCYLCVLAQGKVNIMKESARREKKKIAVVNPGRAFGEMSLLDGQPRSASAVAAETCLLLIISKSSYDSLIVTDPALAVRFITKLANLLSQRLRQTSGTLVDFLQ